MILNLRPVGHMRPAGMFCAARRAVKTFVFYVHALSLVVGYYFLNFPIFTLRSTTRSPVAKVARGYKKVENHF